MQGQQSGRSLGVSPSIKAEATPSRGKWTNLGLLALAELLAMTLWFSASAVVPQLASEWSLSSGEKAWLTISVQLGFALGALASAMLNLPDRLSVPRLIGISTLVGALLTMAIPLSGASIGLTLVLRFLLGVSLAGVYPPAMKLVATWSRSDLGFAIGVLIAALTLGSALPHLFNAMPILGAEGMPPWRVVLLVASGTAAMGSVLVLLWVQPGPYLKTTAPFNWRFAGKIFTDRPLRLANFGYLGHMWELYAMWTWVPIFLIESYRQAGLDIADARLAGFASVASGAIGCIMAGWLADRVGRCAVTIWSLAISGSCALLVGFFFHQPVLLTAVCLVWGVAVVADSGQFSAAVSELSDPRYVGTALTMQTSTGFLLTILTVQAVPAFVDLLGWERIFILLTLGPIFAIASMWKLRRLPESLAMAGGHR
jgi:MFS family permease